MMKRSSAIFLRRLGSGYSDSGTSFFGGFARNKSTDCGLKDVIREKIPGQVERLKSLKKDHGDKVLGETTVGMLVGGMRGIKGLLWETSLLDADEGICFRGYSIPELQKKLPAAHGGKEPLPEGILWLLLTGEIPNESQVKAVTEELRRRSVLPARVYDTLKALGPNAHPMTQLSAAVLALQVDSKFAKAYSNGLKKADQWDFFYEDSMDLIAKMPGVAATIFRNKYFGGKRIEADPHLDWAANMAHMMGFDNNKVLELMRLYQTIHTDHEGGNVSAHTSHVVASALSDPYLSFSAGLNGLAGPLHGLANQEVLDWLNKAVKKLGDNITKESVAQFAKDTLASGQVVPGFGHAVLRKTDPRYMCQREFALENLPEDSLFKLVSLLYEVVPDILKATGKVKNPWPNVDAHSGCLLQHYGITQSDFYTVLFGVSRSIGISSQGVWSRALGMPIERPKSLDMNSIEKILKK